MSTQTILRSAMLALHEVLAELEVDIENELHAVDARKRAKLVARWQAQHDKLARFYDLDVFLDRHVVTSAVAFLAEFPDVFEDHTGGGCMAWRLNLPDLSYLLFTDDGGGYVPQATDDAVTIGWYSADHEPVTGDCDICTWQEAGELVARRVREAVHA